MAIPVGAFLAATAHHNHNEACDELDKKYLENTAKVKANGESLQKYLEDTFWVRKVIPSFDFDGVIYELDCYDLNIGIKIDYNEMINMNLDYLQRYAYNLVLAELVKNTKEKYINKGD